MLMYIAVCYVLIHKLAKEHSMSKKHQKLGQKMYITTFSVADTQLYKRLCPSVRWLVGRSVRNHESKSVKTRISAPAHPSATDGRVSGLVDHNHQILKI